MVSLYPIPVSYLLLTAAPGLAPSPLRKACAGAREVRDERETARKEGEFSRERAIAREEDRNGMRNKTAQKAGELRVFKSGGAEEAARR